MAPSAMSSEQTLLDKRMFNISQAIHRLTKAMAEDSESVMVQRRDLVMLLAVARYSRGLVKRRV